MAVDDELADRFDGRVDNVRSCEVLSVAELGVSPRGRGVDPIVVVEPRDDVRVLGDKYSRLESALSVVPVPLSDNGVELPLYSDGVGKGGYTSSRQHLYAE